MTQSLKEKSWLQKIISCLLVLPIIFLIIYLSFDIFYFQKIYPNIYIGKYNLSGKNRDQAFVFLQNKISEYKKNGIKINYQLNTTASSSLKSELDILLKEEKISKENEIFTLHIEKTIDELMAIGRDKNFFKNIKEKIILLKKQKNTKVNFGINEDLILTFLKNNFSEQENQAKNASLQATTTICKIDTENCDKKTKEKIIFDVIKSEIGKTFQYQKTIQNLKNNLSYLDNSSINLEEKIEYPEINEEILKEFLPKLEDIANQTKIIFLINKKKFPVKKNDFASWLKLEKKEKNLELEITLDESQIKKFLEDEIASKIDKKPKNARFQIHGKKVSEFAPSKDGERLLIEENIEKIKNDILFYQEQEIELAKKKIASEIDTESINDLGIKEIIGTGHSNFAGSPQNRRHNIRTGVNKITGILIAPSEEFSLIKNLGEVDKENGYLPELVIKKNETIKEYGGGLCQVATTLFRAAIQSGLKITARRNHSYRVSYYEPAGTDAAVYDPWPDIKFINDTNKHILIQSRIVDNNLYFDFWGTPDGRKITITDPIIYNIVKPKPKKIIETTQLAPGEEKCTESAHNGADAYFDYKVEYNLSENASSTEKIFQKRFTSHYVPWQAVCLIGVEELKEEDEDDEKKLNNEKDKKDEKN